MKCKYSSPTTLWLGPKCFLLISDPESMQNIFTSPDCVNKSYIYKFLVAFGGDGLFTSDSPKWNSRRKLLKPAFNRKILSSFETLFNTSCEDFMDELKLTWDSKEYDVSDKLKEITFKVACGWCHLINKYIFWKFK